MFDKVDFSELDFELLHHIINCFGMEQVIPLQISLHTAQQL